MKNSKLFMFSLGVLTAFLIPAWAAFQIPNGSVTSVKRFDTQVNKSANYAATAADEVIFMNASGGAVSVSLPALASTYAGKQYQVIKEENSANVVTISALSGSIFYGGTSSASVSLNTGWESWTFRYDGSNWEAVGHVTNTMPVTYTPTFAGFGTTASLNMFWSRRGAYMFIVGQFNCGTSTGVAGTMTIPGGYSIINQGGAAAVCGQYTSALGTGVGPVMVLSGNTTTLTFTQNFTNSGLSHIQAANGNAVCTTGQTVSITCEVQISGWYP